MKRLLLTGALMPATLFSAGVLAYTTVENTALDADNVRTLRIRTYSGPLSITRSESGRIEAEVVIDFDAEWEEDDAREALAEGLVFTLERRGSRAELESWVGDYDDGDTSFFTWGLIDLFRSGKPRPFSHLEVRVPDGIDLEIRDYRGEVIITRTTGDIELRTGGGDVEITAITGDLDLQDGGGDIFVSDISGDVEIRDGGGDMTVERIKGRLTVHDGGGNIGVEQIGGRLDIRDGGGNIEAFDLDAGGEIYDGGGDIEVRRVTGSIALTDGGGGIDVSDVEQDVIVFNRGGGRFNVRNIGGEVVDERGARAYRDNYRYNDNYRYRGRYRDFDEDIDVDVDVDVDVE